MRKGGNVVFLRLVGCVFMPCPKFLRPHWRGFCALGEGMEGAVKIRETLWGGSGKQGLPGR